MLASEMGHTEVVVLLEMSAPVDEKDKDGYTALTMACQNGHTKVVKLLLDKGASVADLPREFDNLLHVAQTSTSTYDVAGKKAAADAAAAAKGLNDNAHGIDRFGYRVCLHPNLCYTAWQACWTRTSYIAACGAL